jgi:putative Mg2+ transporter-C (MgtC) family protein
MEALSYRGDIPATVPFEKQLPASANKRCNRFWNAALTFSDYDWSRFAEPGLKLIATYVMTLPIGWDREREGHGVGIRTFPLVAVASCGYLLAIGDPADHASTSRVMQGLTAGIGFVGGGAILRDGATVHGTATAAGIWATGAIGSAMATGRWEIAVLLSLISFFTLKALAPLKRKLDEGTKS